MSTHPRRLVLAILSITATACNSTRSERAPVLTDEPVAGLAPAARVAHLSEQGGDPVGLAALRAAFKKRNQGYDLEWVDPLEQLPPQPHPRVAFIQDGDGEGTLLRASGDSRVTSGLAVGDAVLLHAGEELTVAGGLSAVVFHLPADLPAELPTFVRPDWDPRITDQPGGCAEETGAYRRILLTWEPDVGPFIYRALNAHRVRITDSFTHYHPVDGGFDEFYLVQMVQPGARLLTSDQVARIEDPEGVSAAEATTLLKSTSLSPGDLVYLPRGTIHRGLGGVLAQIITVPGFRPGAEIGVDHHLQAIAERLGLEGGGLLPYHEAASGRAVVK